MREIQNRLAKLEQAVTGSGKMVVIRASAESEADVEALAIGAGVDPANPRNQVVVLRTFYEERDGSISHGNHRPAEVLSVCALR